MAANFVIYQNVISNQNPHDRSCNGGPTDGESIKVETTTFEENSQTSIANSLFRLVNDDDHDDDDGMINLSVIENVNYLLSGGVNRVYWFLEFVCNVYRWFKGFLEHTM